MPYLTNANLPPALRMRLPDHAQDIYRSAFNNAWDRYGGSDPKRREEIAHSVAWSAVKRKYRKVDGGWVPRADHALPPELSLRRAPAAR